MAAIVILPLSVQGMHVLNLDPNIKTEKERITPIKDLKEVKIGPQDFQVTKVGTFLFEAKKEELVVLLLRNDNLFSWTLLPTCQV